MLVGWCDYRWFQKKSREDLSLVCHLRLTGPMWEVHHTQDCSREFVDQLFYVILWLRFSYKPRNLCVWISAKRSTDLKWKEWNIHRFITYPPTSSSHLLTLWRETRHLGHRKSSPVFLCQLYSTITFGTTSKLDSKMCVCVCACVSQICWPSRKSTSFQGRSMFSRKGISILTSREFADTYLGPDT